MELPEDLLRNRVESEVSFPIMQIIPQLTPVWNIQVATLKWVKKHTTIPVPEVYAYNANPNNEIKGAYILQERVCEREQLFSEIYSKLSQLLGHRLDDFWYFHLTPEQRVIVMKQVATFEGELYKTRFSLIGSIYDDSQTGFRIGPLGPSVLRYHELCNDRGPWTSIRAYLRCYIAAERTWLAECTEDYTVMRRRICPDEDPNTHISYFKSLCDIFLRIIDNAQFLDKIDASFAHFVLFHEDLRTNNILVAYEDHTRVVGLVDKEGARVLPMWACTQETRVAEPELTTSEQYLPLRELRWQVMSDIEPGLSQIDNEVGLSLRNLHYIVAYPLSKTHSISFLNNYFHDELCSLRPLGEDAFAELTAFVAAQRS